MKKIKSFLISLLIFCITPAFSQQLFSRADTLRGNNGPLRTCYDIRYYHLDIKIDIDKKFISGSNLFRFTARKNFDRLQFDLFDNMAIQKIVYKGVELPFTREFNAVFIQFPRKIKKGSTEAFTVFYSGNPAIAQHAPWDGGFVFTEDQGGKPWVAVACQGFGASSWWPNKDQQADEVDSMMISITVPHGVMDVSNGRLRSTVDTGNGFKTYNWFVSYPINNYDVTVNIADYTHFSDTFDGKNGQLSLDYYVLKENLQKAKNYFPTQVSPMLQSFEHWFGPYPFYRDGYKLVETPYFGMEHQSAIAYGNKYQKGYLGKDLSGTGLGLTWDYIIIHESGHEWFGNNITSKDIADMWIHESFTMYSEALFVESQQGKQAGIKYADGLRQHIRNDRPIIGPYHVNKEGSGDMYFKGANMLQTIRTIIHDDRKWLKILRGLNQKFGLKTTTTEEVVHYINKTAGVNLTKVFDQYLRFKNIPTLEVKRDLNHLVKYRWQANVKGFNMPVRVYDGDKLWILKPKLHWKSLKVKNDFIPDSANFYINIKSHSVD